MKLLTLNIWGAPYARHRTKRMEHIATRVDELKPDILCFQEAFLPDCPQKLTSLLRESYPHYHYFASGVIGSGLLTMSRFPIVDVAFHRFRLGGKLFKHGDYYAGKGIGLARISSSSGIIDVYNCHTHAQYERHNDNEYAVYNETNLYEACRFISSHSISSPVILCGDLNTRPDQAGYEIVTRLGNLIDAYPNIHNEFPVTFSHKNPYATSQDQCLDYVMLRNIQATSIDIVMNESLTTGVLAYSDHYALLADIDICDDMDSERSRNIKAIMEALCKRVEIELAETEGEQIGHIERAVLGFASLIDGNFITHLIGKRSKRMGRVLRVLVNLGGLGYGVFELLQAVGNLQARRTVLQSIYHELRIAIANRRLFDGTEW